MAYRGLVLLHLLGVLAFFGNAVAALFWLARAGRSGRPTVVAYAFATLMKGDAWITPASTLAILAGGVGAAAAAGLSILATGWILWSALAFAASGALFVARVLPLQARLAGWTAAAADAGDFDWPRYRRESRRWARWAHGSLALALAAAALMVLRPELPALARGAPGF